MFRYKLRTLLILLAIGPPMLAMIRAGVQTRLRHLKPLQANLYGPFTRSRITVSSGGAAASLALRVWLT
jgi:hypothetical protein